VLVIQGKALDSTGNPLSAANVTPFLNGKPLLPVVEGNAPEKSYETGLNGLFRVEIPTTVESLKSGKWGLKVTRPNFKPSQLVPLKKARTCGSPVRRFNSKGCGAERSGSLWWCL
jgi:hypothetical protein